ncbi:MAG TPA: 2-oxoacid:acceptor oxidoreductase subunit alpha [Herpetosiphonaceae bacterium]|nr:2-oxoacid:acceptor oxidoreductase subunit alpha [Herpetosiphonaceae bacterium]
MSMVEVQSQPQQGALAERPPVVNDFSIVAATVNGSGSQTANTVLIRAIFKMGIPVNGKNLFPSNISGLPTWYTIRLSKEGYVARREGTEILVAFNEKTAAADLAALPGGGVCIYPADWKFDRTRDDVIYYALPVKDFVKASGADPKLRDYVANMAYVGALTELLGIDRDEIRDALSRHFKGRAKAIDLNYGVVAAAADWVRDNLVKEDPYRVERMHATENLILIDGNTAAALGAIFGGVTVAAWYPITPSTSLIDALNDYLPQLRTDPEGHPTYAVIQAEDELAAAGIVFGAGWAGARSMTATSGPGISLMSEFVGLGYFAELPGVIWDIQRMGPSTGLPTRVSQGDVLKAYFLGHGDTRHVCLLPGSVAECFEFGSTAFDLAERLQTPVFVLSDLDLGMNYWMTEPFHYPERPLDRGKVLTAEDVARLGGFRRYADVDGDGIAYRTLPGTNHPRAAYFTRGTGHNEAGIYSERPDDWEQNLARLARKHETARTLVPKPVVDERADGAIGIIAYGSADPAVVEARDRLRKRGVEANYLRLRALPLEQTLREFVARHDRVYVVELNYDGQMCQLVRLDVPELAGRVRSIAHCDGLPLTARFITEAILEQEQ